MKNYILTILLFLGFAAGFMLAPAIIFALETQSEDDHTAREEAEGRAIFEKLQSKEVKCEDLKDEDFQALGEYFMGQMVGSAAHPSMNEMITQMHGREGEKQMHIAMGKRLSGCETNAPFDSTISGFMPMMNMMYGFQNNPMGWSFGIFGGFFMILWWVLIIAGVIVLIKWLAGKTNAKSDNAKSTLDILKERYAKGEIDKQEFEEKKKDLS